MNAPENDFEAQERLRQLGNKKGISSEDIFGAREQKSDEVIARYTQLTGARAISSDMFFNRAEKVTEEDEYAVGRSSNASKHIS